MANFLVEAAVELGALPVSHIRDRCAPTNLHHSPTFWYCIFYAQDDCYFSVSSFLIFLEILSKTVGRSSTLIYGPVAFHFAANAPSI